MGQESSGAPCWRLPILLLLLCAILLPVRAQPEFAPYSIEQETDISTLLSFVGEGDEGQRTRALTRLQELQTPDLVPTLLIMLRDPQAERRAAIIRVLGVMDDRTVVPPLIAVLEEEDAAIRQAAAEALGSLYDLRAVDPLITLLADKDLAVRKAAVTSLGNLRDSRAVEPLMAACFDPLAGVYAECVGSLGYIGDPRAVEALLDALANGNTDIRTRAANGFASILDERAVAPLIAAAGDPEARVRSAVLNTLAYYPEADTRQVLIHALADPEPEVRMAAIYAIEQGVYDIYDLRYWRDAVEPIIACLDDQDLDVRSKAASILGRLGDRRAVEPLCLLLEEQDEELLYVVLKSLSSLRDPRAIEPILKLFDRPRTDLHWEALSVLVELGGPPVMERLLAQLLDRRELDEILYTFVEYLGRRTLPLLAAALEREEEPQRRRMLAELLSYFLDLHALEIFLADAKQREDLEVRLKAFNILTNYPDDPRVHDIFFAAITDEDQEIRMAAFDSLMSFSEGPRVMPALLAAFHGENEELRGMAAMQLSGTEDPRSFDALLMLRNDPDAEMRRLLLEHIRRYQPHDERVLEVLLEAVNDKDSDNRWKAIHALADWYARYAEDRERIFTTLSGKLDDADPAVRRHAATALGALNDIRALEPLLGLLRDEQAVVRLNAATALGKLGDDRAVEPLCRQLGDRYESARTAAKRALAQLGEPRAIPTLVWRGLHELRNERDLRETTRVLQRLGYPSGRRETPTPPWDEFLLLINRSYTGDIAGRQALAELKEPANYEKLLALARGEFVIPDSRYDERELNERLAIEALGRIGDQRAVEELVKLFDNSTLTSKCQSILEELMRFHDSRIIPCLITGFRCGKDQYERWEIVKALVCYDDPRVTSALRQALTNEPDNEVRNIIAAALARRGDEEAFGMLLRDVDTQQRYWALNALGGTGDPRALDKLLAMLRDPEIGNQAIDGLTAFLEAARDPAAYERAVEAALPLIEGKDDRAMQLLQPIARRHDRRATPPLLRLLKNSPSWIFDDCASLIDTGDPAALPPLLELLQAGLIRQRVSVAKALGKCADPRAVPALIDALRGGPTPARIQAAVSLGRLHAREALAPLTAASKEDTSARVRAAAVEALAAIDTTEQ